jgi:hypothetical protein
VLFSARLSRPRPHLDDKVLTAWNGLMIGACARAGRILGDLAWVAAAERAASFLRTRVWDGSSRTLLRRYRRQHAAVAAYAEDYAYLASGLLELFQATGDPAWLEWAMTLHARLDELFGDPVEGGWFSTTGEDASVLLRLKEQYDGAEPAATSVAALNLLALAHLTGDAALTARAEAAIGSFPQLGRAVPLMLAALSAYHAGSPQVVVVGDPAAADTAALNETVGRVYLPTALVVPVTPAHRDALARVLPWTQPMIAREGLATAYVCRDFTCQTPVVQPDELEAQLRAMVRSATDGH